MKNIEAQTTIEINGTEYAATICATVYPAHAATREDDGGEQEIEIDSINILDGAPALWALFPPKINADHYNRCLLAVQNEIDKILEN